MIMKWIFGTSAVVGMATIALGILLVFSGSPATESPDDTRELASALVTNGNGMPEGIQVHGDWVIETRDPDGTLVEKRMFENALHGSHALAQILAHEKNAGRWSVELINIAEGARSGCTEEETTVSGSGGMLVVQCEFVVDANQVDKLQDTDNSHRWIVFSLGVDSIFAKVRTCNVGTTSSDCLTPRLTEGADHFTGRYGISPALFAVDKQHVKVTVTMSFS